MKTTTNLPFQRASLGALALVSTFAAVGCGGFARTPDQYSDDTYKILAAQSEPIRACYNRVLKGNPRLDGNVTVNFVVDNESGRFRKVRIDNARTTAPESVRRCVLDVMHDLKLTPADKNEGRATFTWEFHKVWVKEDGTPLETEPPPT